MAKRAWLLSFFGPVTMLPAVVLGVLAGVVAHAEDEALPPRTQWRASSSSGAQPTMEPAFAIDGDASTKWGGAFSPGHWLQVDLSRTATAAPSSRCTGERSVLQCMPGTSLRRPCSNWARKRVRDW
jgi:hypothetical protein